MKRPASGSRLSYANVVATLALFLALGGGAIAASQLKKNSVGSKQLKKNAVTKAKIKNNAVTSAKIKNNAVTSAKIKAAAVNGGKIADGSVTGTDIDAASTPFSRIVYEARGHSSVSLPTSGFALYPLDNPTFTQEPNSDNTFLGALDVTFKPSCEPPRESTAYVLIDPQDPNNPSEFDVAAYGATEDTSTGEVSRRVDLGPYVGALFQNDSPSTHTIYIAGSLDCKSGEGGTATFGAVDVIGVR
jgi:hypothetical protein